MEAWLSKLLELAVGQGVWAVLYIYLFFRMLKENKERELIIWPENISISSQ